MAQVRVTWDKEVDAASIFLADPEATSSKQLAVADQDTLGTIVLDFDWEGRLLGIEILGASTLLRP